MTSENKLLQAAISHLDLAMLNMCEQVRCHDFGVDDKNAMLEAAKKLQQLASQSGPKKHEVTSPWASRVSFSPVSKKTLSESKSQDGCSCETNIESSDGTQFDVEKNGAIFRSSSKNTADANNTADRDVDVTRGTTGRVDCTTSASSLSACDTVVTDPSIEANDLLKIMMDAFQEIQSVDESTNIPCGIPSGNLKAMSVKLGLRGHHVQNVFNHVERTHDGLIYQREWYSVAKKIVALHSRDEIIKVIMCARRRKIRGQTITGSSLSQLPMHMLGRHHCIFSYKSHYRMMWDILMIVLLVYVALALPLTFAFVEIEPIQRIDRIVDWIFVVDLLLNFRTTFMNNNREEVWDSCAIATQYLKTWFVLDFLSSFPLEQVSAGLFPRLQPAKLIKIGRLAKACKMLRLSKMAKLGAVTELMDRLEEFAWSNNLSLVREFLMLVLQLIVMGHWFACLLIACGGDSIDAYRAGRETHDYQRYLVALYWAMMTMTTVGYGDVTMENDTERLYAIVAMMIGGSFYGYVIGVVTTILSEHDMNQRAFMERMDVVLQWLNNHHELTPRLRRRIWRHFKEFLTTTKAVEDAIILNDLPPQLCNEVSMTLLKDSVRHTPLFKDLSVRALSRIASAISEVKFQADEYVVNNGDAGKSMFIVDRGFAESEKLGAVHHLCAGDSFGEELLLSDVKLYNYSVKTHSKVCMFKFQRETFLSSFKDMPKDVAIIIDNYYRLSAEDGVRAEVKVPMLQAHSGMSSLIGGGPNGVPAAFPDTVLENFTLLTQKLENLAQMHSQVFSAVGSGQHCDLTTPSTCPITNLIRHKHATEESL